MSDDPLDKLDYYALLEIAEDASTSDVRAAFHKFARKYHPDRYPGAPEAKVEKAARIYRRGSEAYRVLCDPEQRKQYDEGLRKGRVRFDPSAQPVKVDPKLLKPQGALRPMTVKAVHAALPEPEPPAHLRRPVAPKREIPKAISFAPMPMEGGEFETAGGGGGLAGGEAASGSSTYDLGPATPNPFAPPPTPRIDPNAKKPKRTIVEAAKLTSPQALAFAKKADEAVAARDYAAAAMHLRVAMVHEPGNVVLEAALAQVEARAQRR